MSFQSWGKLRSGNSLRYVIDIFVLIQFEIWGKKVNAMEQKGIIIVFFLQSTKGYNYDTT